MQLRQSIESLMLKKSLDPGIFHQVLDEMLDEDTNALQVAAFLVLLRSKPETVSEMAGLWSALMKRMRKVSTHFPVLDIAGTGGDGMGTVNISTGSAILAASCGVKVAKHGNRAVSSRAGSADVLEALGINIHQTPEKISEGIEKMGIGFCFAPNFHPAMRKLKEIRQGLNVPSTFNLMGPLLNPARASHFLLGVMNRALLPVMAELLNYMGVKRSMVVHGSGLDEFNSSGPVEVIEVSLDGIKSFTLDPAVWGFTRCRVSDLRGGDAARNAELLRETFSGRKGPIADTLILNAAVSLYLYGKYPSIESALPEVRASLYGGAALDLLNNWIEFSHDECT